jgi:hypothetical protein
MAKNPIPETIRKLAAKYGVKVSRETYECEPNSAASAGENIYLGDFNNEGIELIAFFHELGHALSNERVFKRGRCMSILSAEGTAWELGLGIAYENGYSWDYNSPEIEWARRQLASYVKVKVE